MINKRFYKLIEVPKVFIASFYEKYLDTLFGLFPFLKKILLKNPVIKENTFIVWEPCSKSHAEVVPGFAKYLCDLGYHVCIIVEPNHIKDGLFSRFNLKNVSINKISSKDIRTFFKYGDLSKIKGILTTTVGKICSLESYDECYEHFNSTIDKSRLFFVEHDIKDKVDLNTHKNDIITLREMDYKNAKTIPVNPHYFGDVKITPKNDDITNFLTVGVIKPRKKNNSTIIDAVKKLHQKGITNFKVTVVGKGKIKDIPKDLRRYFDIKGRLPFSKMYDEIEKSDFIITAYDNDNSSHLRYITTGTSGNFQLVYGFLKPCLLIEKFAPLNKFNSSNAILYDSSDKYCDAMEKAIKMSKEEYSNMQDSLKESVKEIYGDSLKNLEVLIHG